MKILFLDIDSVLNCSKYGEDLYYGAEYAMEELIEANIPLCVSCIKALMYIFKEVPDLKVVWSTDWRLYDEPTYNGYGNPRFWLEKQPWMKDRIIGKTPKKMSSTHYEEIRMWFTYEKKDIEVEKFAILDDYATNAMFSYFKDNFFQCWYDDGLTMEIAEKVVKHLKGQDNAN